MCVPMDFGLDGGKWAISAAHSVSLVNEEHADDGPNACLRNWR